MSMFDSEGNLIRRGDHKEQLDAIEMKLETLQEEVDRVDRKLDEVLGLLRRMNKDTTTMGKHVEFVESVYNQVKKPFHYLMGAVDTVSGMRLVQDERPALPSGPVAL